MTGVSVNWKRVQAAWRRSDFTDFWLLVKPADDVVLDSAVISQAAGEATDRLDVDGLDEGTVGGSTVDLAAGVAVYLARTSTKENLQGWLAEFAGLLAEHGYAGEITSAPESYIPDWVTEEVGRYQIKVFTAFTTQGDTQRGPHGLPWAVSPDVTRRLADLGASWTLREGGRGYMELGIFLARLSGGADQSGVADALAAALPAYLHGGLWALDRRTKRVRTSSFAAPGLGEWSYANGTLSWRERLKDVLAVLREIPDLLDLAMVRPGPVVSSGWQGMEVNGPAMRGDAPPAWYHSRRDQLRDTVPDAHGVQLLTGAHLARAHDLSAWRVEEIAPDRYLVGAQDLDPWFRTGVADPDVVAAARADFGDMLTWRDPT